MAELTTRDTTTTITGGFVHIIIPDGTAPTGYKSFKISTSSLLSGVNSAILTNSNNISLNNDAIFDLQSINGISKYEQVNSNQTWLQEEGWVLEKLIAYASSTTVTLSIGTTPGGVDVLDSESITSGNPFKFDFGSAGLNVFLEERTLYITITGGTISFNLYYSNNSNLI